MKKGYQKGEDLRRGKVVYVGVDVHKDSWHVTVRVVGFPNPFYLFLTYSSI